MCWRVLDIPASIGSTRCAGSRPAPFFPCVRSALSVLFVIGGSLAPGVGDLVLVDAILTPTREPSLLSSQVQQRPGHPRVGCSDSLGFNPPRVCFENGWHLDSNSRGRLLFPG